MSRSRNAPLVALCISTGISSLIGPANGAVRHQPPQIRSGVQTPDNQDKSGDAAQFISRFKWIESALTITEDGFYIDIESYAFTPAHELIEWWTTDFKTPARAKQQMENELKLATKTTERRPFKDASGRETGERALAIYMASPSARQPAHLLIWTRGSRCSEIKSSSIDAILEFERYAAAVLPPPSTQTQPTKK
jgi:hypothetical protein